MSTEAEQVEFVTQDSRATWHEALQLPARGILPASWTGMLASAWQVLLVRQCFVRSHDNYFNSFSFALFWRQKKSPLEAEFLCCCVFKMSTFSIRL